MKIEFLIPLLGYLLGSIPFGYLLVRLTTGADIRQAGSGNIGATNVYRKSKIVGVLTFILDGGKGYVAVLLAGWLGADLGWQAITAVSAIVGHIFTLFLGFKGGKGVATGFGAFLALTPASAGTTMIVFILTAVFGRYISLASILATAAYPLWVYLYHEPVIVLWAAIIGSAMIIVKHHPNIRRLIAGTEQKFGPGGRSRSSQ